VDQYDVQDVWEIMPDIRGVTLLVKTSESGSSSYSLLHARRKDAANSLNAVGNARIKVRHATWQLWQTDLDNVSAPRPKAGDRIVDSSDTWVVDADQDEENPLIRQVFNLRTTRIPS
jgi:hypothetical protein